MIVTMLPPTRAISSIASNSPGNDTCTSTQPISQRSVRPPLVAGEQTDEHAERAGDEHDEQADDNDVRAPYSSRLSTS